MRLTESEIIELREQLTTLQNTQPSPVERPSSVPGLGLALTRLRLGIGLPVSVLEGLLDCSRDELRLAEEGAQISLSAFAGLCYLAGSHPGEILIELLPDVGSLGLPAPESPQSPPARVLPVLEVPVLKVDAHDEALVDTLVAQAAEGRTASACEQPEPEPKNGAAILDVSDPLSEMRVAPPHVAPRPAGPRPTVRLVAGESLHYLYSWVLTQGDREISRAEMDELAEALEKQERDAGCHAPPWTGDTFRRGLATLAKKRARGRKDGPALLSRVGERSGRYRRTPGSPTAFFTATFGGRDYTPLPAAAAAKRLLDVVSGRVLPIGNAR